MKEISVFNNENVTTDESQDFRIREAVRAIIFDSEHNIAIIHAKRKNFYKLPGGGGEDGENLEDAIVRECKEEIGCEVLIQKEVGYSIEYRKLENLTKLTYCYIGKNTGEKQEPHLMDDEIDLDISIEWVSIEKAIELIKSSNGPANYIAEFSVQRDVMFLEEAKIAYLCAG